MLTSIQSRLSTARAPAPVSSRAQARKTGASGLFGDAVASPGLNAADGAADRRAGASQLVRILARQDHAAVKNLAAQKLAPNSLINRSLAPNKSAPAADLQKAPARTALKAAEDETGATPPSPTDSLSAALKELGYDPSKFRMEMREEKVEYPGGSYMHRYTHVELPNGLSENFTTDLMARYPAVTANEIRRLMENQYSSASFTPVAPPPFHGGT